LFQFVIFCRKCEFQKQQRLAFFTNEINNFILKIVHNLKRPDGNSTAFELMEIAFGNKAKTLLEFVSYVSLIGNSSSVSSLNRNVSSSSNII